MKDEKTFVFFASISDSFQPPQKDISRATTIIGFHVYEVRDDGKILLTGLMQNDLNLKGALGGLAAATAMNALPKQIKGWH